jgi:branched-chain amino acid transport system permease protein
LIERLRADARLYPLLALAVVGFGLAASKNATLIQAGTYAGIYGIAAIGLSVLLGNVAQISVGQAGFFGIGAYVLGYLTTERNWSWLPAAAVAVAAAAGFGIVLGFIALRFRGHYLAMATLTFGLIVAGVFHEAKIFGGASGISNVPFPQFGNLSMSGNAAYWFAWGALAICAYLAANLLRNRTGRAFEAIRNDELAAEVLGVPTRRYKILAFTFAGALAGFAGTIYAGYLGLVVPDAVSVSLSIDLLLMVVLGGAGGVSGAIVGALLIGITNIYGHGWENWRPVIYGIVVILVVIFFPRGLVGIFTRALRPARSPAASLATELPARASARVATAVPPARSPGVPWLRVDGVTKRFGGLVAVDDVSFALENGTLTSLIGPNGAGKTTLFNAICGVGTVNGGRIAIAGRDMTNRQPHEVAALGVGRSFQNARLFAGMTVLENVIVGAFRRETGSFIGDALGLPSATRASRESLERARRALSLLDLERLADVRAKDLPFGDRRRVELARALAAEPGLLLVDEPAAGLNASERERLRDDLLALRAGGVTLLLIEHDMRLVMEISDRIMVLKFGKLIADGTASIVRNDPEVIAAYLGTAAS